MTKSAPLSLVTIAVAVSAVCAGAWRAEAATYVQTNLVSNLPGAEVTDPALVNPWGITETTTSPFWVSDQGVSLATLYMVTNSTTVSKFLNANPPTGNIGIPTNGILPQGPTGTVANTNTSSFAVGNGGNGASAHFIFANLNGTISAWNTIGQNAFIQATTPGAVYTGLAVNAAQTQLYAANRTTGTIDVFNSSFQPVPQPGKWIDPSLPGGLAPFNVQDIGGKVYVTYANLANISAGQGAVSAFDENGNFLFRVATGGSLAAPWGVALAPSSFGQFGGDLLVGNFGTNSISAFDPTNNFAFLGSIAIKGPGGLLALEFGSGSMNGGSPNTLYFTDLGSIESAAVDGLFGAIEPTPLPAALPLFATGLGGLGLLALRRKRKAQAV